MQLPAPQRKGCKAIIPLPLMCITELAKQLEQAKIQVKEETPVFSILEPCHGTKRKVEAQETNDCIYLVVARRNYWNRNGFRKRIFE